MSKDILIVRLNKNVVDENGLEKTISEKFKNIYTVLVIIGENETDKTTFEIIKYEN